MKYGKQFQKYCENFYVNKDLQSYNLVACLISRRNMHKL